MSDSFAYMQFAESIASGKGYAFEDGSLTAFWPVGTSAVYALLFSVFGVSFTPIVALNLALGAGIIALTHGIARRYVSPSSAALAAWLVACWPLLIQFTTVLASELLFVFFLLAALYVWGSRSIALVLRSAGFGALLCAACYVRPTALPLIAILPAVEFWAHRSWRQATLSLLVAGVTAATLFAPWAARNHEVFGKFALVSTNFGQNLWMGNNPQSTGAYMPMDIRIDNEVDAEAFYKKRALDYIRDNPLDYVKLSVRRFVGTFDRESIGVSWNEKGLEAIGAPSWLTPLKAVSTLYWWAVSALAVAGVWLALQQRVIAWVHPLTVVPLLFFAVPVLTVSQDRYHVPLNPFIAVFAGLTLVHLVGLWRRRRGGGASHTVPQGRPT